MFEVETGDVEGSGEGATNWKGGTGGRGEKWYWNYGNIEGDSFGGAGGWTKKLDNKEISFMPAQSGSGSSAGGGGGAPGCAGAGGSSSLSKYSLAFRTESAPVLKIPIVGTLWIINNNPLNEQMNRDEDFFTHTGRTPAFLSLTFLENLTSNLNINGGGINVETTEPEPLPPRPAP